MSDFFKSAFGYFSGNTGGAENEFVGEVIEVGNQKLRVKRVIAEGGYAFVYEAVDSSSGREYALKRLLSSDEPTSKLILQEISFLKKLAGHPNVVKFIGAASVGKEKQGHVGTEFLLLTELCKGGQLVDLLRARGRPLPCDVVLQVMYQTCKAVQHMHNQLPPIIHRDLKVENLLLSDKNTIKLCDFGSCTTRQYRPDQTWTASQRGNAEDEIFRNTTPMYRAPEMLDLYQNFPITEAADIWALGCVLFLLCYNEHPFEDSAKLRIINGNFTIPPDDRDYLAFHQLINGMLQVDPRDRPPIDVVVAELQEIAAAREVKLTGSINFSGTPGARNPTATGDNARSPQAAPPVASSTPAAAAPAPPRPPPPSQLPGGVAAGAGMLSMLKGGAGNIVRNLKDASNKMMETVSSSMSGRDLDFSYITTRVAVMSFPAEGLETAFRNHIEDVRAFLEARHPKQYAVYNLASRKYRAVKFDSRVSESAFNPRRAPPLAQLFAVCKNMHLWLRQTPRNICVVHCMDGREASATVVAAFLCFCRLFDHVRPAIQLFAARRVSPQLCASQLRYVDYICRMVAPVPGSDATYQPHHRPVMLVSLNLSSVPMFNKLKNGCRPFAEVYVGDKRVITTSQEYDKMRGFQVEDRNVVLPLNVSVVGDVTIIVYHARSTFGGKITSIRILQLQFHSGFVQGDEDRLTFQKHELDGLDADENKYAPDFAATIDVVVSEQEKPRIASTMALPWENFTMKGLTPRILFLDRDEMRSVVNDFCRYNRCKGRPPFSKTDSSASTDSAPSPTMSPVGVSPDSNGSNKHSPTTTTAAAATDSGAQPGSAQTANFFDTLEWDSQPAPTASLEEVSASSTMDPRVADLLGFVTGDDASTELPENAAPADEPTACTNGFEKDRDSPASDDFELLNLRDEGNSNSEKPNGASPDLLLPDAMPDDTFDPFVSAFGSSGKVDTDNAPAPTSEWTADFSAFDPFGGGSAEATQSGMHHVASTGSLPSASPAAGSSPHHSSTNLLAGFDQPAPTPKPAPSQQPPQQPPQQSTGNNRRNDPFADLGNLLGTKPKQRTDGGAASPNRSASPRLGADRPVMGSGYRMSYETTAAGSSAQSSPHRTAQPQQPQPTPTQQQPQQQKPAQQSSGPNYSRQNFAGVGQQSQPSGPKKAPGNTAGVPPKPRQNAFEDLLGGFQASGGFNSQGPRTINEMRKEKKAKTTDPDVMKVEEWVAGKERNIRALLCSLHQLVNWEDVRWKEVSMAELVSSNQVKKAYRKAVLDVHPDKTSGSPNENLARLIFIELSDAWTEFEDTGMKSLY